MIRLGLILALVIIAAGAWLDWSYHAMRTEIAELQSRLNDGPGADTAADCRRVSELRSTPLELFKHDELAALAKRCAAIKAEGETPHNP